MSTSLPTISRGCGRVSGFSPGIALARIAVRTAPGQKTFELQLTSPEERLAVELFSRKYRIEPKAFIQHLKGSELGSYKLI